MAEPKFDKSNGHWYLRVRDSAGRRLKKTLGRDPRWRPDGSWPASDQRPEPPHEILVAARPLQDADAAARLGRPAPGLARDPLDAYLRHHVRSCELSKSRNTLCGLRTAVNGFLGWADTHAVKHVQDVTRRIVREYLEHLAMDREHRYNTIATRRGLLAAAFNDAVLEDRIPANPWHGVKVPRQRDSSGTPAYTAEEIDQIAAVFRTRWHRDLWLIGTHCGFRSDALRHLQWRDVRWSVPGRKTGIITCPRQHSKSGREYSVPLAGRLLDVLQERFVRERPEPTGLIFPGPTGRPVTTKTWADALRRACCRAGIPYRGHAWHAMRATFASLCHARGVNPRAVQAWMGHSSIQQTDRYIKWSTSSDDDESAKMEGGGDSP